MAEMSPPGHHHGHPVLIGCLNHLGIPIKLSETPEAETERWPTLGQHTDAILNDDLGMETAESEDLRARGVIRSGPTP